MGKYNITWNTMWATATCVPKKLGLLLSKDD